MKKSSSINELAYLHQLEWEALMKDAVDACTARQLGRVDLVARTFYALFKVHRELLHHPANTHTLITQTSTRGPSDRCIAVHSLQQSLGLAGRVVGPEVFVLLHLLLNRQQLTL